MLKDALKEVVQGEIFSDMETREAFSRDASIFEVMPELVIAPKNSEDIKNLVRVAGEQRGEGFSLTVRSGGSGMTGGSLSESIVLDMARNMNKIIDIGGECKPKDDGVKSGSVEVAEDEPKEGEKKVEAVEQCAVVEPGVFYRDFDLQTRRRDLLLPSYPASKNLCTLGGMIANNSGGEKTLQRGKTDRYVRGLKMVLSDGNEYDIKPLTKQALDMKMRLETFEGEMYRNLFKLLSENDEKIKLARPDVSKNSAGYALWDVYNPSASAQTGGEDKYFDLTKLMVGSQGTLGIITRAKVGLVSVEKNSQMLIIFLRDLSKLGEIIVELIKHSPQSIESYDNHTIKLAIKFFPQIMKLAGGGLKFALRFLPDLKLMLGGLPKLVLMVEFTGHDKVDVGKRLESALAGVRQFKVKTRVAKTQEEENKYWTIRRESFNLLRKKIKNKHTAPFIDDFAVRPERLPEFLPKLNALLDGYDLTYTIAGHPGDGNFHIIPLMDLSRDDRRAIIPELSNKVYDLVLEYKGTITAEHNDGLIRTPYLEKMYGPEIVRFFEEVKKIFDPYNIFNPGKKVWGNLAYSLAHISKK